MSDKHEAPQFNPKHRIVGAVIVVALAVILVPLILDEHETPPELKSVTEIPPAKSAASSGETKVVVTPVADLAPPEKGALPIGPAETSAPVVSSPVAPSAPKTAAHPEKPAPVTEDKSSTTVEKPATQNRPAAETEKKAAKGWIVQIGVFKERANADRLTERLQGHGFKVISEQVNIDGGRATRLRMGPYRDQASALKFQARLEKEADVKSVVFAYPHK